MVIIHSRFAWLSSHSEVIVLGNGKMIMAHGNRRSEIYVKKLFQLEISSWNYPSMQIVLYSFVNI